MTYRQWPWSRLTCLVAFGCLLAVALPGWSQSKDTPPAPRDLLAGCTPKSDDGKNYRVEFNVTAADLTDVAALELTHMLPAKVRFELNGQEIPVPHPMMHYPAVPAIDPKLLKTGANVLTARIEKTERQPKPGTPHEKPASHQSPAVRMSLLALKPEHAKFEIGPILGDFGDDYFTVTGRINMGRLAWVCDASPANGASEGTVQRVRMDPKAFAIGKAPCIIILGSSPAVASNPVPVAEVAVPRMPGETFEFIVFGDCRTHPDDWSKVASSILKAKPSFVVCTGDLVTDGLNDSLWGKEFFGPGRELFSRVPLFCVMGNHENESPAYDDYIYSPGTTGKEHNWAKTFSGVTLIGIDGKQDWSADSANAKWLKGTLKEAAKSRFIFLVTHYPAWSSGTHGAADEKGLPKERPVREARQVILPLLSQHNAQALIAGHDHVYERSEPVNLPAVIITGGGGAPLYPKTSLASKQNPYSKVFASKLHYCRFAVAGNTCTMTAVTPDGTVLDSRTWKARK